MRLKFGGIPTSLCIALVLVLISSAGYAQRVINGTVTNAKDKLPVPAVSVTVKGTNLATATTNTGTFTITLPAGKNILVFSSGGYEEAELTVGTSDNVAVALKTRVSDLNEVVVTGYTSQKKKDITGAVSVVNVKDLKQMPVGTGEEALQGRAAGVTVISSGQPGAASDIRIRGITAFGNNSPLVIIDGVQANLHDINSSEIESIQVLKDAAAAIYGVRGSNGVIIVTTRKGKAGKARVTYDAYFGTVSRGTGYDMANSQEEADAMWLQQRNSGITNPTSKQYGSGATPRIPDYITPAGTMESDNNPLTNPDTYDINSNQITRANKTGTNWYNEITRDAPVQNHNLSVSGGGEKSSYLFALGYLNQQGIAKYQYNKRYSARINTQFNVKNNIRIGENMYLFYKENPTFGNQSEGSPFTTAFRESTVIPVYDIKGNFAGTKSQDFGNARNPYADIYRTKDNKSMAWDMVGNLFAEIDFAKHFTARSSFGGTIDNNHSYNFNYVGYENAEGNTGQNSFSENAGFNTQWTWTNTISYLNDFGKHNVKVLAGTEALNSYGRNINATRSSYFSELPDYWIVRAGSGNQSNDGGAYRGSVWSQFARLEYGYAGKYLVNASVRRDGASVFAEDVRYGVFPSVAVAWRISNENFMRDWTWINDLKIRASWGELGSYSNVGATNPYNLYATRLGRSAYDIAGTSTSPYAGFYASNIGNPSTSWESDIISNIGLDGTMFGGKFDFSFEYYQKKVSGLLFTAAGIQWDRVFTGDADLPKVNIGNMENKGFELTLGYHSTIGKELKLDLSGNITTYNNKIADIPGAGYFDGPQIRNVTPTRNVEGHPVGAFFGYQVLGLFQSADEVAKAPTQTDAAPGLFRYADINADGKIDADDRTFIGDPNPDFTYGLNIGLTWRAFDFSTFFFGSSGNDIFNQTKYFTDFPDFFKGAIRREAAVNSWSAANPAGVVPKLQLAGGFSSDQVANSYFISDGSYLRNKQIQIGYTLPTNLVSRAGIERLRIYIQAANLFTMTSYTGLDPELQSSDIGNTVGFGIDQGNYPHTKSFLFGINLNF
jgi:TonB-dependent starch-binding outer membrane protein SusC